MGEDSRGGGGGRRSTGDNVRVRDLNCRGNHWSFVSVDGRELGASHRWCCNRSCYWGCSWVLSCWFTYFWHGISATGGAGEWRSHVHCPCSARSRTSFGRDNILPTICGIFICETGNRSLVVIDSTFAIWFFSRKYRHTHSYVGTFLLRSPKLLLLEPKLINEVFVSAFRHFENNDASRMIDIGKDKLVACNPFVLDGDEWRLQRGIFSPLLTSGRIRNAYCNMQRICGKLCDYIEQTACNNEPHSGMDVSILR